MILFSYGFRSPQPLNYPDLINDKAEANTFGAGKNGFTEGSGDPSTRSLLRSTFGNAWTREILASIEASGQTPSGADLTQLNEAIIRQAERRAEQSAKQYSALTALANATPSNVDTSSFFVAVPNYYDAGSFQFVVGGSNGASLLTFDSAGSYAARTMGSAYTGDIYCGATNTAKNTASGVVLVAGAAGGIQTCPYNGAATWTKRTQAASYAGTFRGAVYASSLFVLCGDTNEIQTSPDGTTWTRRTAGAGFTDDFLCATHHAGLYILGGENSELQTSPTGTTWTRRTIGGSSSHILSLVSFGDYVVALKANGSVYYSLDGITWTLQTSGSIPLTAANALFVSRDRLYALGHCTQGSNFGNVAILTDVVRGNWRLANLGLNSSNEPSSIYCAAAWGPERAATTLRSKLYLVGLSGGTGDHVFTEAFA